MLELSQLDENLLAAALLCEEHDLLTVETIKKEWFDGQVQQIEEIERSAKRWVMSVTYDSMSTDETSAFPCGEIEASSSLTPGENDAYRSGIVVYFDDLIAGHRVIVEGDHCGSGSSDESHSAHVIGTIEVIPVDLADAALTDAIKRHRRDLMKDVAWDMEKLTRRLHDATGEEMAENGVSSAFMELARHMARSF